MRWFWQPKDDELDETKRQVVHAAELHGVPVQEVVETILDEDGDGFDDRLEDGEERPNRHIGAWVTTGIIGLVFGIAIIVLIRWATESDQAGPNANAGPKAIAQSIAPTPLEEGAFQGHYIAFSYPGEFNTVKALPAIPNSAERYIIGSTGDYRRSIDVEVESNTPVITDDSGYQYRHMTPSLYQPVTTAVDSEPATVMVGTDGTERTLYWAHAGYTVIVSLADTTGTDNLAAYMQTIISSLHWVAT